MINYSEILHTDEGTLNVFSNGQRCEINGKAVKQWQYYPAWMDVDARAHNTKPIARRGACYDEGYTVIKLTDNALPENPRTMRELTMLEALTVLSVLNHREAE